MGYGKGTVQGKEIALIMCKCGRAKCTGYYLLHYKELNRVEEIKEKELKENPNCIFDLIDSPSSGETPGTFKELHVLNR